MKVSSLGGSKFMLRVPSVVCKHICVGIANRGNLLVAFLITFDKCMLKLVALGNLFNFFHAFSRAF